MMKIVSMRIEFSKRFVKQYTKLSPKIQQQFDARLNLFRKDPYNKQLRNHALTGTYMGLRSINISGDLRALYKELESGEIVIYEFIGTHSQLYG